jgi:UDPglucose 6-dehydrogenase
MQVAVVGTGCVGLVSAACLADVGHMVEVLDPSAERTAELTAGVLPFFEPGLPALVAKNVAAGRLTFSTSLASAARAQVVFLAVATPATSNGEANLEHVLSAAAGVAPYMSDGSVLAVVSTVPVGTGALIEDILVRFGPSEAEVTLVVNPTFLRQGTAISDFLRPERVVIGTRNERAAARMRKLYRPVYPTETPIIETTVETAELIKYASNAFLAVKIGFANEMANLCDRIGADVEVVTNAMGLDRRIGSEFLHAGPGYGGACLPKDTKVLSAIGVSRGARQVIVEAAIAVNERQRANLVEQVRTALEGARMPTVAVLGLAFKANTSDICESPAIFLAQRLAAAGVSIRAFEPCARDQARDALAAYESTVAFCDDPYEAAAGADALILMTDSIEFRNLDLARIRRLLRRPTLIDPCNVLDPVATANLGFDYVCTGRQAVVPRRSGLHK